MTPSSNRLRRLVFGPPLPERVPERVDRAIADAQGSSEILVSLLQLAAVLTFGILYALTPKAFPPDVPFEPVPVTLGVYAVFTLFRLWLACLRRLPRWFLVLSVVVDISVLMLTIWSFHLQYRTSPALYLKAPTLMYVFILIALRTLRFDPWLVLVAGGTASLGWLALVAYALYADPSVMITRDFITYMMSFSVLIGAEFDKVVSMLMVTIILWLAIIRCRRILFQAVADQIAAAEMSRFFAPEIAGLIRDTDRTILPGDAVLREAAILTVDLRGFTPLSQELPPRDVVALLSEYQSRVVPVVRAHGGSVDKYMGDGILASFGATQISTTAAADALRAVETLLREATAWSDMRRAAGKRAPRIGAAVASGRVMFGAIGDQTRLEYTVIGEPVNLAAKLEKHTKVEEVRALCSRETYDLAIAQGFAPEREPVLRRQRRIEGVHQPLDLVILEPPGGEAADGTRS